MNVFDILGPVMIGPSSSHTAGAARIGRITRALLGAPAVRADILLHGSFAKTYKGHGTDKALIAGIMGMETDDSRIRQAPELAREQGLQVNISTGDIDGAHPNTARITLTDSTGRQVSLLGSSVGGGNILVTEVNGMAVSITGQQTTLIVLHRDAPGTIASVTEVMAEVNGMAVSITGQQTTLIVLHRDAPGTIASVTEVVAEAGANICNFRLSRQKRGGEAVMTIEVDGLFGEELNETIKTLDNVYSSTMLQPI